MCRIDLCGQIGVWAQKIYESDFMKMRSLKLHVGADSPTRGYSMFVLFHSPGIAIRILL